MPDSPCMSSSFVKANIRLILLCPDVSRHCKCICLIWLRVCSPGDPYIKLRSKPQKVLTAAPSCAAGPASCSTHIYARTVWSSAQSHRQIRGPDPIRVNTKLRIYLSVSWAAYSHFKKVNDMYSEITQVGMDSKHLCNLRYIFQHLSTLIALVTSAAGSEMVFWTP